MALTSAPQHFLSHPKLSERSLIFGCGIAQRMFFHMMVNILLKRE